MRHQTKTKPLRLRNLRNNQIVICDDFSNVRSIDGEDFVEVHEENSPRKFWLNKSPLQIIKEKAKVIDKRS